MAYTRITSRSSSYDQRNSIDGDATTSSASVQLTVQQSTPDSSGGLYGGLGGDAVASGEDTLTSADLAASMVDEGTVTTLDAAVTAVAVGQSSGELTAFANASTFATVGGAEYAVSRTQSTGGTSLNDEGSIAYDISTTTIRAYDVPAYNATYDSTVEASPSSPTEHNEAAPLPDEETGFDGNIALIDFNVVVLGDDTLLLVDAFAISLEDELSISTIYFELAGD